MSNGTTSPPPEAPSGPRVTITVGQLGRIGFGGAPINSEGQTTSKRGTDQVVGGITTGGALGGVIATPRPVPPSPPIIRPPPGSTFGLPGAGLPPAANDPVFRTPRAGIGGGIVGAVVGTVVIGVADAIARDLASQRESNRAAERQADIDAANRRAARDALPRVVFIPGDPVLDPAPPLQEPAPRPEPVPDFLPFPSVDPLISPDLPTPQPQQLPEIEPEILIPTLPSTTPTRTPARTPALLPLAPALLPFFLPSGRPVALPTLPFANPIASASDPGLGLAPNVGDLIPNVPTSTTPTIASSPRFSFLPNPSAQLQPDTAEQRCQELEERKKRRGECEEGIYRQFEDDTEFSPWRIRNCASGEIVADPKGTVEQQEQWQRSGFAKGAGELVDFVETVQSFL